jgi:carboxyl-terminal processing protease
MPNFSKKNIYSVFLVAAIFISFVLIGIGAGYMTGWNRGNARGKQEGLASCEVCKPEDINFSLFWEAWRDLKNSYVDPQKIDTQKMIYGAISGMVDSLGDPYTVFFNPDDTKKFNESAEGVFEGIGAEIDKRNGQILIVAPLEGTPAQKAGLRAGDKILKIDDKTTDNMTSEEAVSLIRGPKDTEVTLTILREGWETSQEFKIKRALITVPSLKWELKTASNGDKVAYLRLYQFSENARSDFKKAASEILKSPANKLILDLRDNPGGYLQVAEELAGWFLKRGDLILIQDSGEGKEKNESRAQGNENFLDFPMVVLINNGSASASEILAGALRDDRGVKLIGEKSFGKGTVQQLMPLSDGSSLKVTIAKWLTPKGISIIDNGLEPDVKIEMTENDYNEGKDPQLDKALEVIQGIR